MNSGKETIDEMEIVSVGEKPSITFEEAEKQRKVREAQKSAVGQDNFEPAYKQLMEEMGMRPNLQEFQMLYSLTRGSFSDNRALSIDTIFRSKEGRAAIRELRSALEQFPDKFDRSWKVAASVIGDGYLADTIRGGRFVEFLKDLSQPATVGASLVQAVRERKQAYADFENTFYDLKDQPHPEPVAKQLPPPILGESASLPTIRPVSAFDLSADGVANALKKFEQLEKSRLESVPEEETSAPKLTWEDVKHFEVFSDYFERHNIMITSYYADAMRNAIGKTHEGASDALEAKLRDLAQKVPFRMFEKRCERAQREVPLTLSDDEARREITENWRAYIAGDRRGFDSHFSNFEERHFNYGLNLARSTVKGLGPKGMQSEEHRMQYEKYLKGDREGGFDAHFDKYGRKKSDENLFEKFGSSTKKAIAKKRSGLLK